MRRFSVTRKHLSAILKKTTPSKKQKKRLRFKRTYVHTHHQLCKHNVHILYERFNTFLVGEVCRLNCIHKARFIHRENYRCEIFNIYRRCGQHDRLGQLSNLRNTSIHTSRAFDSRFLRTAAISTRSRASNINYSTIRSLRNGSQVPTSWGFNSARRQVSRKKTIRRGLFCSATIDIIDSRPTRSLVREPRNSGFIITSDSAPLPSRHRFFIP